MQGSLRNIGVNVLGMPSKKESLVVALRDIKQALPNASLTAAMVAPILLGARCFINWPHLQVGVRGVGGVGGGSGRALLRALGGEGRAPVGAKGMGQAIHPRQSCCVPPSTCATCAARARVRTLQEALIVKVSDEREAWSLGAGGEHVKTQWDGHGTHQWQNDNAQVGAGVGGSCPRLRCTGLPPRKRARARQRPRGTVRAAGPHAQLLHAVCCTQVVSMCLTRWGIDVGRCDLLVHTKTCKGYVRHADGTVQRQLADQEVMVPLQVCEGRLHVRCAECGGLQAPCCALLPTPPSLRLPWNCAAAPCVPACPHSSLPHLLARPSVSSASAPLARPTRPPRRKRMGRRRWSWRRA